MKKIITFLLLVSVLFSCKKDDNGDQETSQNVFGSYRLTSLVPSIPIDADGDGTYNLNDIASLITCNFRLVLVNDNTYSFDMYRLDTEIYQNVDCCDSNGNLNSIDPVTCSPESFSGTFTVSEPSIILKAEIGSNLSDKILNINNGVISYSETGFFHSNLNGNLDFRQVLFQVTFTKI